MRFLHTSDWHLGQTFHQFDRTGEHQKFLDWLLRTLVEEKIDALLIAGDIFDTSNPSATSQKQLYRFLTEANRIAPHLNIVITAGNHDSPGRLEAPSPFLDAFNAVVVGQVTKIGETIDWEKLIVPLKNRLGKVTAWCIAMPFLRPGDVPRIEESSEPFAAGFEAIYRMALDKALEKRSPGEAIIAIGHCHLRGGKASADSERNIVIGGSEALSVKIFDPAIAYVALGHLHLAQKVGGEVSRRYSGSPIPLSFSEVKYSHQVVIFEVSGEVVSNIREILVPRSVELLRVPEVPRPLNDALKELESLELKDLPIDERPFLQVRIQLTQPEPTLRAQVESAIAEKPLRLVMIETVYPKTTETEVQKLSSVEEIKAMEPRGFFQRLYREKYGEEAPAELLAAFSELLTASSGSEAKS